MGWGFVCTLTNCLTAWLFSPPVDFAPRKPGRSQQCAETGYMAPQSQIQINQIFLKLCSHESHYKISWERLRGALIRWGYPPSLTTKRKISWNDKPKYINPKSHARKRSRIHAFRAPHHSAIPISFSRVVRGSVNDLSFLPDVHSFAMLQPPPNLGKFFQGWRTGTLRKACAPDI